MTNDPIVDEVRRIRQEYAAKFDYNVRAMAQDLQKRRKEYADRLVTFPPKPVRRKKTV